MSKYWRRPVLIDPSVADSSAANNNVDRGVLGVASNYFPMLVLSTGATLFHVGLNRASSAVALGDEMYGFVTQPNSFSDDSWGTQLSEFVQVDAGAAGNSVNSQRPIGIVDQSGNAAMVIFTEEPTTANIRPFGLYKTSGTTTWSGPTNLQVTNTVNAIRRQSASISSEINNNIITVWCQGTVVSYDEYRPFGGWRLTPTTGGSNTVTATACNSNDVGMSVAFDGSSPARGFIAFVANSMVAGLMRINVLTWGNDNWSAGATAEIDAASANFDSFPKLFIDSDGNVSLFFYRGTNTADFTTATSLMLAKGSTVSGTFTTTTQFDNGIGAGANVFLKFDANDAESLQPVLAYKNSKAVMAFVKQDASGFRRLFVSTYSGNGNWATPEAVDEGVSGDVTWADAAINASGKFVVTYSIRDTGGTERVYGRVNNGSWESAVRLDTKDTFLATASAGKTLPSSRPSVAMDSDGNAVVTFSINDTTIAGTPRRAVAVSYR